MVRVFSRPGLGWNRQGDTRGMFFSAFHCAYSSGIHTAHGRYPAALAAASSEKNTRFFTYPPRMIAARAARQSSRPKILLLRWPPTVPGVALSYGFPSLPMRVQDFRSSTAIAPWPLKQNFHPQAPTLADAANCMSQINLVIAVGAFMRAAARGNNRCVPLA